MAKIYRKPLLALLLPLLLCGCTSITNLTPSQCARADNNLYHVEAAWRTDETAIRPESIKPQVVIGFDTYPMTPVPLVQDRWETFVPAAADQDEVIYHFKFDFVRNTFSLPRADSIRSRDYTLKISK